MNWFGTIIGVLSLVVGIYNAVEPGDNKWISGVFIGLGAVMIYACGYLGLIKKK